MRVGVSKLETSLLTHLLCQISTLFFFCALMRQCSTCSFGFFVCSIIEHGSYIACTALTRLSVNKEINLRALIPHAKCQHVHMLPCRVNSYFVHSIMSINNSILGQTHTTALHTRFTNCAPNTRVLTSQGSCIEIIQAFFSAGGGCSEMSVCFPLTTQLPEMHPFSDIQY